MSNLDFQRQSAVLSQYNEVREDFVTGPLAATVSASAVLDPFQLRQARDFGLFVDSSGGAVDLSLPGDDSSTAAADLQSILGLENVDDECILRFISAGATITESDLENENSPSTDTNVHVRLHGSGGSGGTVVLFAAGAAATNVPSSGEAIVRVTADNVTVGSEEITFDILLQGASANS